MFGRESGAAIGERLEVEEVEEVEEMNERRFKLLRVCNWTSPSKAPVESTFPSTVRAYSGPNGEVGGSFEGVFGGNYETTGL